MVLSTLILAAGQGTRMRSNLPKVLHPIAGKAMIRYTLELAQALGSEPPVIVIGHGAEGVQKEVGDLAQFAIQEQQLGTAHAVMAAEGILGAKPGLILVLNADIPLLRLETLKNLVTSQENNPGPLALLTVKTDSARGFGRIVRSAHGYVTRIVEEAQATPEELAIKELNVGAYCIRSEWLWQALKRIQVSPKGEYYLTDLVALAVEDGLPVAAHLLADPSEAMGINNRVHLAEAEEVMRQRINTGWMIAGVTFLDPEHVYIEASVQIGRDTVIMPNTYLRGNTVIGEGCMIGPNTIITDTQIGNYCEVLASVLDGAVLEDDVDIGPFARLRKGAYLCKGVHMGNFGEVKSSTLGAGTKMGHFSYIGDATIGENVNIGAGTITCNYDGVRKHKTRIGDGAFIGSDTMLVAPVEIGTNSRTGAGSVVTHDVPPGETVVGVPARIFKKKE
ncbi:MAG TPA: bifunctional UDP-N-acetylglucosamine diphosphorylase/glucosamine-1-phosphate N-acetyltransferase GlmU [Anaerolineaceae bacterium]